MAAVMVAWSYVRLSRSCLGQRSNSVSQLGVGATSKRGAGVDVEAAKGRWGSWLLRTLVPIRRIFRGRFSRLINLAEHQDCSCLETMATTSDARRVLHACNRQR